MPGHAQRHCAVNCAKMVETIEMPFGLWTPMGASKETCYMGAHWSNLANNSLFGRPFVKRFALYYRSVVLSVCLSVCL